MGLYSKYVLPRLIDVSCRSKDATQLPEQVVLIAEGTVLEVGISFAVNLPHHSGHVVHRRNGPRFLGEAASAD